MALNRRSFLRMARNGLLLLGAGGVAHASLVEPQRLETVSLTLPYPHLPPGLEGLKIGLLSDFHLGPYVPLSLVERAVALMEGLKPHMVALVGDFIYASHLYFKPAADALAPLKAPLGLFAVLGNHDHKHGASQISSLLADRGVKVLSNANVPLTHQKTPLHLIGVDDYTFQMTRLDEAVRGLPPQGFRILLSHNPAVADLISGHHISLLLAGHTHGGQIRLPYLDYSDVLKRTHSFARGLGRKDDTLVYVTRGVGTVPPPIRISCPPEVTLLTLKKG